MHDTPVERAGESHGTDEASLRDDPQVALEDVLGQYIGPDMARHNAPGTFTARADAEGWIALERRLIEWDEWAPPAQRRAKQLHDDTQTLRTYADTWLPERTAVRGLKPKTVSEYQRYLDRLIYPTLGEMRLKDVTPATVRAWIGKLNARTPRINEHAYALLKTIFATAVQDELLDRNPCRERMRKPFRHIGEPATLDELALLVAAMPERLRLMIELAAWCALRFGEFAELRRGDVDLRNGEIRVSRAVQWVDGKKIVAAPKADSVRVVAFPPHLGEAVKEHLRTHAQWGKDGLLFPTTHGEQYRAPTFHQAYFRKAREAAGRPNLRFHDLRHTGATLAAASGATLAELMQRLGHSTVSAALAYQHAAQGSDKRIAVQLSAFASAWNEN
ncbi:tyrosine-type recombinase/integrase [Micropruina glycogenica]|nr:site-specific integrase [Micropruina glycogenica]